MLAQAGGAARDSLRAALDSVFAGQAYAWQDPPTLLRFVREWWDRLTDWLSRLAHQNPAAYKLFTFAILAVLAVILAHAGYVTFRAICSNAPTAGERPATRARDTRDAGWYFREADRMAGAGRWSEAMRLAFVGLALRLDEVQVVRYHPSKTPGDFLREARLNDPDRRRLRALVAALYRHVFGAEPCDADAWARWRAEARAEWHASAH